MLYVGPKVLFSYVSAFGFQKRHGLIAVECIARPSRIFVRTALAFSLFSIMAMVGLRASFHRILDRIEHMLPSKLRPIYNHPAGNTNAVSSIPYLSPIRLTSYNSSCVSIDKDTWAGVLILIRCLKTDTHCFSMQVNI